MKFSSQSKKTAVILSYISVALQAFSTMILTSFYLKRLGPDAYGLYQMIYAVAQYILILDLGIGTVMIRYISEYDAINKREKAENFAFHFLMVLIIIILLIVIIGVVVNLNIENIYVSLTLDEYALSHQIFIIMIIQLVFTVISHYFRGICEAFEKFVFTRMLSVVQIILNLILAYTFVWWGMGIYGIVIANTLVILLNVIITIVYVKKYIGFKVKLHKWEISMLKPVFLLMLAMLLQSIVGHVNSSVDKTILGIMTTKADVAIYSIAATIITMFNTIPTMISSVFQSKATRLVVNGLERKQITDFVIRPGRIQFIMIGGFVVAFIIMGRDFIECWTGKNMLDAWKYVLIILLPNAVPLMQNTCLAILNAMDKRLERSLILVGMTVVNIILTISMVSIIGPIGAPIATGISYVIGHCIIMNVYYQKVIGFEIKRMFLEIFRGTWKAVLLSFIVILPLIKWESQGNWLVLLVKAVVFIFVYCIGLFFIGLNREEKVMLYQIFGGIYEKR